MQCCFQQPRPFAAPSMFGCQFFEDGQELFECDDKLFCEYHLPTHDHFGQSTIKGRWSDVQKSEFADSLKHFAQLTDQRTDFSGAVVPTDFRLDHQCFHGDVWFLRTVFERAVTFDNSTFRRAHFQLTQFKKGASFNKITVKEMFGIDASYFGGAVYFDNAEFGGVLTCSSSEFSQNTYFRSSSEKKSFHWVSFSHSEFKNGITFENRVFQNQTDFSHCCFHQAPEFHGCILHQDTKFDGVQFLDTASDHAARAYRTLKLAMENVRARQEEADFFALEQKSLRGRNNTKTMVKVISWLYECFSDYGRNVFRPAYLLAISWFYFFLLYASILRSAGNKESWIEKPITLSVKQVIRPFWIWFEPNEKIIDATLGSFYLVKFFATIQSTLSITLIALFLLALRRNFKMD